MNFFVIKKKSNSGAARATRNEDGNKNGRK